VPDLLPLIRVLLLSHWYIIGPMAQANLRAGSIFHAVIALFTGGAEVRRRRLGGGGRRRSQGDGAPRPQRFERGLGEDQRPDPVHAAGLRWGAGGQRRDKMVELAPVGSA